MLFFADDEQDNNPDNEEDEDADFDENSDEEEDDDSDDNDDEDSDDSEDSDEEADDEDEDNKPVTRKELRDLLKGNQNKRNAGRRVSSKKGDQSTKQPSDADKRLAALEKQSQETAMRERKRTFGYENGLSPKQVNHVFRLTKRPTTKFLNKPHVKAALEAIKSQESVARNTPSGSGKRGRSNGNGKAWTELKPEERQSSLADRRREILANKRQ